MSAAGAAVGDVRPARSAGSAGWPATPFGVAVDHLRLCSNERLSCTTNNVGHLQKEAGHELCLCPPVRECECIERGWR